MFDLTCLQPRKIEFPLVSVVVPCYNVEQYIDQCLNSILDNGYPNLEVICVDDHSTDRTVEHIQNLMKSHSNIQLYDNGADHNIYGGACRNIGMEHAKGKYIYFCDSDDYVLPGIFAACVGRCDETNADMCMFRFQVSQGVGKMSRTFGADFTAILDKSVSTFYYRGSKNILTMGSICAWNKFFNVDYIRRIGARFQELKNSNDQTFVARTLLMAKRVAALDYVGYVHRNSTSTSVQKDRIGGNSQHDILSAFEETFKVVESLKDLAAVRQFEGHVYNELRYMQRYRCKFSPEFVDQLKAFAERCGIYHLGVRAVIEAFAPTIASASTPAPTTFNKTWDMFDKIVCIHYLPYEDRIEGIKSQLKRVGILDLPQFEWHYTVDNKFSKYLMDAIPPDKINKWGVCDKNIKYTIDSYVLLKQLQHFGYQRVLFLEDDIMFHNDLNFIRDVVQSTPQDFDVINYDPFVVRLKDIVQHPVVKQVGKYVQRYQDLTVFNMSCCALSRKAICRIVQRQEKCLAPFDYYTWAETGDLNTYCVTRGNNICIQDLDGHANKQTKCPTTHSKYPRINIENYWKGEENQNDSIVLAVQ